jgi:hypothetical protein
VKMRLLAKDTGLLDIVAGVRLLASRLHVADALTITLGRRADPALSRDASNADYDPSDDLQRSSDGSRRYAAPTCPYGSQSTRPEAPW